MKRISIFLSLILSFLILPSAFAEKHKGFHVKEKAYYLSNEQIKNFKIDPPPANDSQQDKLELKKLKEIQSSRTEEDCKKAIAQKYAEFEDFFADENPFPSPMPKKVKKFFKLIKEDTDVAVSYYKNLYAKPRPFDRDKEIQTCFGQKAGGYGYPSGHAAISEMYALILSDLVPEKKEIFEKIAKQASLNRLIWGVHHPSDVEAGRLIAQKAYEQMKLNKDFIKKRDALKKYLKK